MKTDGGPEGVGLAVVIVRQSLIKLSGERWTRVREEDFYEIFKRTKIVLHHVMAQNAAADQSCEA